MLHIMSRETARQLCLTRFFLGTPCRNGHLDERLVCNNICLACARKNNKVHYKRALKDQRSTDDGRERRIANDRRYLSENRAKIAEKRRARYAASAEKMRAQRRDWAQANPESVLASQRKVRFLRMRRAPKWLTAEDWSAMEALYTESRLITERTGIQQHVDHIVPLVGKTVSGLHVPWNLQVIPATENLKKSNKLIE
jgi:hypothetical protein